MLLSFAADLVSPGRRVSTTAPRSPCTEAGRDGNGYDHSMLQGHRARVLQNSIFCTSR